VLSQLFLFLAGGAASSHCFGFKYAAAGARAWGFGPATGKDGAPETASGPAEASGTNGTRELDIEGLLGEERIDEFFDPRGFARQRARAKRQAAHVRSLSDAEVDAELPQDDARLVEDHLAV
ncbi:MAG: hypothetical protein ACFCGT_16120, partial [Sandaracinaceae bacterium]